MQLFNSDGLACTLSRDTHHLHFVAASQFQQTTPSLDVCDLDKAVAQVKAFALQLSSIAFESTSVRMQLLSRSAELLNAFTSMCPLVAANLHPRDLLSFQQPTFQTITIYHFFPSARAVI